MEGNGEHRAYPPTFVSRRTLAYLLDCSEATVDSYIEQGMIPKGSMIGNLRRWYWPAIEARLALRLGMRSDTARDEFVVGVGRVQTKEARASDTS